jgi:hypothetical protein
MYLLRNYVNITGAVIQFQPYNNIFFKKIYLSLLYRLWNQHRLNLFRQYRTNIFARFRAGANCWYKDIGLIPH